MTPPSPPPSNRPRVVEAAFWVWLLASVVMVLFGALMATTQDTLPALFRGAGLVFALAGLGLGYITGRVRSRHAAFRRAAVALALAVVVVLAVFSLMTRGLVWPLIMILAMVGAILMMRPSAQHWFDAEET
jgi:peptidoglycan/LPS O-acetylase OafA/YrhL